MERCLGGKEDRLGERWPGIRSSSGVAIKEGRGRDNEVGIGFGVSEIGVGDGILWIDVLEGRLWAPCGEDLG